LAELGAQVLFTGRNEKTVELVENTVSPWFTRTPATESVLKNQEKLAKIISRTP